jgi:hypothetical protein
LQPQGAELLQQISLMNIGEYRRTADQLSQVLRRVRALNPEPSVHKHIGKTATKPRGLSDQ